MQEQKSVSQLELAPTDVEINAYLQKIESKKISEQQYQRLLKIKQNFDRINTTNRNQNIKNLQILHAKPYSQQKNPRDALCYNCYQQVSKRSKTWCRMCGQTMCNRCMVRIRRVEDGEQIYFCQKCDQKYLKAMLFKRQYKQELRKRKALQKIVKQYEMLEKIIGYQKQKVKANGEEKSNKLLETVQYIKDLKTEHKQIRSEIEEVKNKINFGRQISVGLKKKLYNLRLQYGGDIASSYGTEIQSDFQPPQADSEYELSVKDRNINQSMVNSFLEESKGKNQIHETDPRNCNCIIY